MTQFKQSLHEERFSKNVLIQKLIHMIKILFIISSHDMIENEQVLNECDSSSGSDSCETSLLEGKASSESPQHKLAQFNLIENEFLLEEEQAPKISSLSYTSEPTLLDSDQNINLEHNCSYFEMVSVCSCEHTVLGQKTCVRCEYNAKEHNDSLNHMAFMSPNRDEALNKNWLDELKFESPTHQENATSPTQSQNECLTLKDNEIIDSTLEEEEFEKTLNETVSCSNSRPSSQYSICSNSSYSTSFSESTIYWSDSDNSDGKEDFHIEREDRRELRRIKALEKDQFKQEKNLFFEQISSCHHQLTSKFDSVNRTMNANESWFCPLIDPPLPESGKQVQSSNENIAQFYKSNKKFKLVSIS